MKALDVEFNPRPGTLQRLSVLLKQGSVGVLPTDTLYGLVGSALNKRTVEKIYRLRKREKSKPLIVLIADVADLKSFGIRLSANEARLVKKFWPGPVSVILPCPDAKFKYLHRGGKTLAVRLPKDRTVRKLLKLAGPLVAPSANVAGAPPALTIQEAKDYFGSRVVFYAHAGKRESLPSTLVKLEQGALTVLREGAVKIHEAKAFAANSHRRHRLRSGANARTKRA